MNDSPLDRPACRLFLDAEGIKNTIFPSGQLRSSQNSTLAYLNTIKNDLWRTSSRARLFYWLSHPMPGPCHSHCFVTIESWQEELGVGIKKQKGESEVSSCN